MNYHEKNIIDWNYDYRLLYTWIQISNNTSIDDLGRIIKYQVILTKSTSYAHEI